MARSVARDAIWLAIWVGFVWFATEEKRGEEPSGVQVVPEAIEIGVDQEPLAQRWNAVPLMQFQRPSGLHAPAREPSDEAPVPFAQVVPAATGIGLDQEPLAQR